MLQERVKRSGASVVHKIQREELVRDSTEGYIVALSGNSQRFDGMADVDVWVWKELQRREAAATAATTPAVDIVSHQQGEWIVDTRGCLPTTENQRNPDHEVVMIDVATSMSDSAVDIAGTSNGAVVKDSEPEQRLTRLGHTMPGNLDVEGAVVTQRQSPVTAHRLNQGKDTQYSVEAFLASHPFDTVGVLQVISGIAQAEAGSAAEVKASIARSFEGVSAPVQRREASRPHPPLSRPELPTMGTPGENLLEDSQEEDLEEGLEELELPPPVSAAQRLTIHPETTVSQDPGSGP